MTSRLSGQLTEAGSGQGSTCALGRVCGKCGDTAGGTQCLHISPFCNFAVICFDPFGRCHQLPLAASAIFPAHAVDLDTVCLYTVC